MEDAPVHQYKKVPRFDVTTLISLKKLRVHGTTQTNDYHKPLGNTQTHIARRAGIFPAHLARDLFLIDCSAKCGVSLLERLEVKS